jgi:nicotinate-nucleotide--dimethylbenzimidazole phosphoribosyltransferase
MDEALLWLQQLAPTPCQQSTNIAIQHQQQLTKPPGSLGRLEQLAIQLAGWQKSNHPQVERINISIFAADHGIARENISAFPQAVTAEMIRNFASGGAAIAVLARQLDADLRVCNLGTAAPLEAIAGVESRPIAAGTANFLKQPAMTKEQLTTAINIGREHAEAAQQNNSDLFIGGEMGIGNTTSATALASALLTQAPAALVGPGTGISAATQQHKLALIEQALQQHTSSHPLTALQCLGGFEIAALAGAMIRCAQLQLPVIVDGFIASAAALAAAQLQPSIKPWLILAHQSTEPGHALIIQALQLQPLLQLELRLGEASGAAIAVPLLRLACALHNEMATFASASVSTAN